MHRAAAPVETLEPGDGKPHPGRRLTEDEFVAWCDDKTRAEWVDGDVIVMSPVSQVHDTIGGWLSRLLGVFVEQRDLGAVCGPELQVRLGPQRRRRTPDLLFIARDRLDILRKNHVEGAPDLIVEIVSPDSVAHDWREKYLDYQAAGVHEYWVVDPGSQRVEAYALTDQRAYEPIDETDGRVTSTVVPGFFVRPSWLWTHPHPKVLDVLGELGVGA